MIPITLAPFGLTTYGSSRLARYLIVSLRSPIIECFDDNETIIGQFETAILMGLS